MRRFWLISVLIFLTGAAAATNYALSRDKLYQARAVVSVENPELAGDLVGMAAQQTTILRRLALVEQRILSRGNLSAIVEKYDLFSDADFSIAQRSRILRSAIDISHVMSAPTDFGGQSAPSSLVISVSLGEADLAAQVANELVTAVIEREHNERSQTAQRTVSFLDSRAGDLNRDVAAIEAAITGFKMEKKDSLPESLEFLREEIRRLEEDEQDVSRRILALENERAEIEHTLQQGGTRAQESFLLSKQARLRAELEERQASFPASHPAVRNLADELAIVEIQLTDSRAVAAQNRLPILDRELAVLTGQRDAILQRLDGLEDGLAEIPQVEIQLLAMLRDRDRLQERLSATNRSLADAQVRLQIEENRQSQQLSVLEEAVEPEHPISRSRKVLLGLGLIVSLGGAIGAALLLDRIFPVLRNAEQMARLTGLAPIVAVPRVRRRLGHPAM